MVAVWHNLFNCGDGLGAGATGQAMAAEDPTTTDIDPTSTKTGEDDSQNTDSDNRDVDGDGLDDETGQPIPTNPSDPTMVNGSGTTSNPTDGEETTATVATAAATCADILNTRNQKERSIP